MYGPSFMYILFGPLSIRINFRSNPFRSNKVMDQVTECCHTYATVNMFVLIIIILYHVLGNKQGYHIKSYIRYPPLSGQEKSFWLSSTPASNYEGQIKNPCRDIIEKITILHCITRKC